MIELTNKYNTNNTEQEPKNAQKRHKLPIININEDNQLNPPNEKNTNTQIEYITTGQLEPHPGNRKVGGFNKEKLIELAKSITSIGMQVPIIARPHPQTPVRKGKPFFQIVAGERRWRAAKIANTNNIPAIIKRLTDDEVLEIQLTENLQRDDIHPLDECESYIQAIQTGRYTPQSLSDKFGKSITYITKRIQLAQLTDKVRKAFIADKIPLSYIMEISRLYNEKQEEALKYYLGQNDTFKITLQGFKDHIKHDFLDLTTTAFDLEKIYNTLQPCNECSYRTVINKELFDDFKDDRCGNGVCYQEKVEFVLKEIIAKEPKILRLQHGYVVTEPGAISLCKCNEWDSDWDKPGYAGEIPDKKDYKKGVIIDGHNKGNIIYVKVDEQCNEDEDSDDDDTDEEIAKDTSESLKTLQITNKAADIKYNLLLKGILKKVTTKPETLKKLVPVLKNSKEHFPVAFEHFKLKNDKILADWLLEASQQDVLLFFISVFTEWSYRKGNENMLCDNMKIDVQKIEQEAMEKAKDEYNKR